MFKSYPAWLENILTGQIILFTCLPGEVFGHDERNNESSPVKRQSCGHVVYIILMYKIDCARLSNIDLSKHQSN